MHNNKYILSICIPTYNRARILENTLEKLFNNPDFDSKIIEVIVSDNCSTDDTSKVVRKFPLVKYSKNEINIGYKNFINVLNLASGKYIKLFNDTLNFKPLILKFMLEKIKQNIEEDEILLFYINQFNNSDCVKEVYTVKDFIKEVSFYNSWIGNFGMWKNDYDKISNKEKYADTLIAHIYWILESVSNKRKSIIYFGDYFDIMVLKDKGGDYSPFKVFGSNYLNILKTQDISILRYEHEKYRIFKYYLYPGLISLLIVNKINTTFDTNNAIKIIYKKYWYEPYLYIYMIAFFRKKFLQY